MGPPAPGGAEAPVGVVAHEAINNDATISSVNYAEVLQKSARRGVPAEDVDGELDALTITVSPFGRLDARLPPPSTATARA
jgi:ribonuclease VapC